MSAERQGLSAAAIRTLASECGFELAGVASPEPVEDQAIYASWVERGLAASMTWLADHRAVVRQHPSHLLSGVKSILCVGKLYNGPQPHSVARSAVELSLISRYAWGPDYHIVLRRGLLQLAEAIKQSKFQDFRYRVCVDTAPLLERTYARQAGLGWIGRNTCLINQFHGSWFFLGELLTTLEIEPDSPPPDRCGTCRRCIDACPTQALVPNGDRWELDARRCISYLTIEHRGPIDEQLRPGIGPHVFGCDVCQDVCPWNRRAPVTDAFSPVEEWLTEPPLERLAAVTEEEFRSIFRLTPMERVRYRGFLRNVATAMGNSKALRFVPALEKMAQYPDAGVADHARWALEHLLTARVPDPR